MRFRIFDKCGSDKISACAVTSQHDFLRVDSKFFRMIKGVSDDTVRLLDCCRKRLFRCKAVVHIPDKAVQLLHQGAAIAAVTVGAALDKATTVEIQQQGCFGGQMLYIVPSLGLTVAMTSDDGNPSAQSGYRDQLHGLLAEVIASARNAPAKTKEG